MTTVHYFRSPRRVPVLERLTAALLIHLPDATLLAAGRHPDRELSLRERDALVAEIKRRGLDV